MECNVLLTSREVVGSCVVDEHRKVRYILKRETVENTCFCK